jgi:TRAP-type C4-dicarboxylate transport system permease small subunit
MKGFLAFIFRLSTGAQTIAGITLTVMMLLTVTDVILRSWGKPLLGTFELVAFMGAIVIGFSIPFTSLVRGHIYVDFFLSRLPGHVRRGIQIFTRLLSLVLFALIAWNLVKMGTDLQRSGEVSLTLQMPFFPIVYAIGGACFIQCLVLAADIVKILENRYE